MTYFFCPETMGLYPGGLTGDAVGKTAVELTEAEYRELAGLALALSAEGLPILAALVAPSAEQLTSAERAWRDSELASVAWLRDRHRDQLEIGKAATFSEDQYSELLFYIQALRDWPQSDGFPTIELRPGAPLWIAEQSQ